MSDQTVNKLEEILQEMREASDKKTAANLELDVWDSIIKKINSFSPKCDACSEYIIELEGYLSELMNRMRDSVEIDFKQHKAKTDDLRSHLSSKHEIKTNGYYMSIFMSIGMGIGMLFGTTIFDNIGLGLAFGVGIGIAIGAGLDEDAKKKGKML